MGTLNNLGVPIFLSMKAKYIYLGVLFFLLSCVDNKQELKKPKIQFNKSEVSGINFINKLTNLPKHNALVYETFYNGGGVAIGDINNDGLNDIYFSGNQVADQLYLNKGNLEFEEITLKAGIVNDGSWSTGVTMVDINQDGFLDIYVCKSLYDERPELRKNKLYINQGNLFFVEKASEYGLADMWRTQEAAFFDFDNDEDLDVIMINQPPNPGVLSSLKGLDYRVDELGVRLLENRDQFFVDVTNEKKINHSGYALSVSVSDFNKDGWQDVFIAHDYNAPDRLYINNGGQSFVNTADESFEQISFFSMGTDAGDINNDGLDDIISLDMVSADPYRNKANMGGMNPEAFWRNVERGGHYQYMFNAVHTSAGVLEDIPYYSNVAMKFGMAKTDWSWSPLIADFDNDGYQDVFISNGIRRDLRFTDGLNAINDSLFKLKSQGWTQEDFFNKLNYQPFLETLPSQEISNYLYHNKSGYKFEDMSNALEGSIRGFSSGAAFSDLDNDGDLDLVINNVDGIAELLVNNSTPQNYLRVVPVLANKQLAVGARVELHIDGEVHSSQLRLNRGFYSASEPVVHFGLGDAQNIDRIEVVWNDKEKSIYKDIDINQQLVLKKERTTSIIKTRAKESFKDIVNSALSFKASFSHEENNFNDYSKQVLLPHQIGVNDAPLLVQDFNQDDKDDLVFCGGLEQDLVLYIQDEKGFRNITIAESLNFEATDLTAIDIEADGDLDFYISTGGNAFDIGSARYKNYFAINNGSGEFTLIEDNFSKFYNSDSKTLAKDINKDGKTDLLVLSRHQPGTYPVAGQSYVLINKSIGTNIKFETNHSWLDLETVGMVTDAEFKDLDNDGDDDLVIVSEWGAVHIYKDQGEHFEKLIIDNTVGWWMDVSFADINHDGKTDIMLGNLGKNSKYKTSAEEPFKLFFDDIDDNDVSDIVLAYSKEDKSFPVRGRSCSSEQIPDLKEKFPSYHEFALADVAKIYEGDNLRNVYVANEFSSGYLLNKGDMQFSFKAFPSVMQKCNINDIVHLGNDIYLATGNMKTFEIETPKLDASYGHLFKVAEDGDIELLDENVHPLFNEQIEEIHKIKIRNKEYISFIPINGQLQIIEAGQLN